MERFITLTLHDGQHLRINDRHIIYFRERLHGSKDTFIQLTQGSFTVKENPADIELMLKKG